MTPQQAQLVKRSFWIAESRRSQLAGCFLAELFARDPALWRLFSTDPAFRADKLHHAVAGIVASIDRLHPIVPVLEWLAFHGAAHGLSERHHVVIADALLAALESVLAEAFTPALRQSWWLACRSVIDVMVHALEAEPLAA
jgi:hemoglobin-like flavoprotein